MHWLFQSCLSGCQQVRSPRAFHPKWAVPGPEGMLNLSYPSLPGEGLGDQALEPGVYVCVCVCVWNRGGELEAVGGRRLR